MCLTCFPGLHKPFTLLNSPGTTDRFEYQESAGVNRTAWLTVSRINSNAAVIIRITDTVDSKWRVKNPAKANDDGDYDWLTYLGTDGAQWHCKVHCEGKSGPPNEWIHTWFEDEKLPNYGNKDRQFIEIVDWQGGNWKLEIQDVPGPVGQPHFYLSKLGGG
jgi:hypothetical protein